MSLLMFMHQEKSALILTDTLATPPDGDPFPPRRELAGPNSEAVSIRPSIRMACCRRARR